MAERAPSDLVCDSFDWCVYGHASDGVPGSVVVVGLQPRASAIRYFADEMGVDFGEVRCTTRWGHLWDRQDSWDYAGRDRWQDDHCDEDEEAPDEPPADWEPDECDPVWSICKPDAPGATKVWILEVREGKR